MLRRILTLAGVLFLGLGVWIVLKPGMARKFMLSLFGPPQAELQEAYADTGGGETFDHSTWNGELEAYVDADGFIDYDAWSGDTAALDAYLASIAEAPFDALGRDQKLAFLINAYNAFTVRLILDHWPVESIKDIPSAERWDAVRWNVGGKVWSLNQIEHEQVRPKFAEPRIHFSLVCAAVGCPPLRNEAFAAERLEEQLDGQTQYVHDHGTWFAFDAAAGVVRLTSLYDWYGGDFVQMEGSVLAYAAKYSAELKAALDAGKTPKIEWLPYDWAINSTANRQDR